MDFEKGRFVGIWGTIENSNTYVDFASAVAIQSAFATLINKSMGYINFAPQKCEIFNQVFQHIG